jgi:hypothetical protein
MLVLQEDPVAATANEGAVMPQFVYDVVLDHDGAQQFIESGLSKERAEEVAAEASTMLKDVRVVERAIKPPPWTSV